MIEASSEQGFSCGFPQLVPRTKHCHMQNIVVFGIVPPYQAVAYAHERIQEG